MHWPDSRPMPLPLRRHDPGASGAGAGGPLRRGGQYRRSARFAPMSEELTVGARIYLCSVRLPKSLVPAEFVRDPAPAPFRCMLDPAPTRVLPISASAVC